MAYYAPYPPFSSPRPRGFGGMMSPGPPLSASQLAFASPYRLQRVPDGTATPVAQQDTPMDTHYRQPQQPAVAMANNKKEMLSKISCWNPQTQADVEFMFAVAETNSETHRKFVEQAYSKGQTAEELSVRFKNGIEAAKVNIDDMNETLQAAIEWNKKELARIQKEFEDGNAAIQASMVLANESKAKEVHTAQVVHQELVSLKSDERPECGISYTFLKKRVKYSGNSNLAAAALTMIQDLFFLSDMDWDDIVAKNSNHVELKAMIDILEEFQFHKGTVFKENVQHYAKLGMLRDDFALNKIYGTSELSLQTKLALLGIYLRLLPDIASAYIFVPRPMPKAGEEEDPCWIHKDPNSPITTPLPP